MDVETFAATNLPSGNDCYIAIEHGPFSSLVYLLKMVIPHSYVCLPKGRHQVCKKEPTSICDRFSLGVRNNLNSFATRECGCLLAYLDQKLESCRGISHEAMDAG